MRSTRVKVAFLNSLNVSASFLEIYLASIPGRLTDDEMFGSVVEIGVATTEFVVLATLFGWSFLGFRVLETTASNGFSGRDELACGFCNRLRCDGIRGRNRGWGKLQSV